MLREYTAGVLVHVYQSMLQTDLQKLDRAVNVNYHITIHMFIHHASFMLHNFCVSAVVVAAVEELKE